MWDVAVVGAGLAGCAAALAASGSGASVLLLESEQRPGGNSRISAGLVALAGTGLQVENGVEDGPDRLSHDLLITGGGENDPALIRAYADGQAELQTWFRYHGIGFTALERGAGQSVARAHQTDATFALDTLVNTVRACGAMLRTGVRVLRLHPVSQGLRLETRDSTELASTAVLATGGFAASDELLATFAPEERASIRVGMPGCRGDGLRMGWALGTGMRDMSSIKGTFGAHADSGGAAYHALLAFYMGGIVVNRDGRRFVNEELPYKLLGDACLDQPGGTAFQVFDDAVMQQSEPSLKLFDPMAQRRAGRVFAAPDLPGLARLCDIDPDRFEATVSEYNDGIEAGRDAWGRIGLCNGSGALVPLRRPPFYAFPCGTALLATYCGLRISPQGQVLDVWDQPIAGLFAAGEVAGGFHGTAYMTGAALGAAVFFGDRAGRAAANHASGSQEQQGRPT